MSISVCLASYNGALYIKQQLDSIIPQLRKGDEIIISDDGSTDGTIDIISSMDSAFIRLVNGPREGVVKNFENVIMLASNEHVFLCDQDDVWSDNKVVSMMTIFDNNEVDVVVSDCSIVDKNGDLLEPSFFKLRGSKKGTFRNIYKNSFLGCCMAIRKDFFYNKVFPFPNDIPMHDWWIGLVASAYGNVHFLNEKLICYRRHGNNASPTGELSNYSMSRKLKDRVNLVFALLLRFNK